MTFNYSLVNVFVKFTKETGQKDEINVIGLVSIIVFYLIVLAIGIWAGWRQKVNSFGIVIHIHLYKSQF